MTGSSGHVPHQLGEHLAQRALQLVPWTLPVDLDALAHALQVVSVSEAPLHEDGRTTWLAGAPSIQLRADRPRERQRFTFAHELAHVLLAGNSTSDIRHRTQKLDQDAEETLCDWIAAALLMPAEWMRPLVAKPMTLPRLRGIASSADVSLSAAAVRASELGRHACTLLRWQRSTSGGWHLVGQAGVPTALVGRITATRMASVTFDAVARRDTTSDVQLLCADKPMQVVAQMSKRGATLLTLITSSLTEVPTP